MKEEVAEQITLRFYLVRSTSF